MIRILPLLLLAISLRMVLGGSCLCTSQCDPENTVGYEYYSRCYYIKHNETLMTDSMSRPVTTFRNETVYHLFKLSASEFRQRFNVSVISVDFKFIARRGVLGKHFHLPSYDLNLMRCPAIDLESHIIFDEYPYCGELSSNSKFFETPRFHRLHY